MKNIKALLVTLAIMVAMLMAGTSPAQADGTNYVCNNSTGANMDGGVGLCMLWDWKYTKRRDDGNKVRITSFEIFTTGDENTLEGCPGVILTVKILRLNGDVKHSEGPLGLCESDSYDQDLSDIMFRSGTHSPYAALYIPFKLRDDGGPDKSGLLGAGIAR